MEYEMKLQKNQSGWKATTEIKLEDVAENSDAISKEAGERILRLSTSKGNNGVTSTASVFKRVTKAYDGKEYCSEQHVMGFGTPGGDYYRTVKKYDVKRVTEKAISEAHKDALTYMDAVLHAAKAHYNIAA